FDIDTADGLLRGVRMRIAFETDEIDRVTGWFATIADVSSERAELRDLRQSAERDALTGVYNQNHFDGALAAAIADAERNREHVGLLMIEVDRFRDIGQLFGHDAGNTVIRFVARVLTSLVRGTDSVVRLGRNEFAVILARASDEGGIIGRAKSILSALSARIKVGRDTIGITASMGVAIFPQDAETAVDLFAAASYALAAVPDRPSVLNRYDASVKRQRRDERRFFAEIRRGLRNEEFMPFFQPKVDLETGSVVGFEALCRWCHPSRGLLTPGAFHTALDSPHIGAELSDVTLIGAFRATHALRSMALEFGEIAINLSPAQLAKPDLARFIEELQHRYGTTSREIVFEVLENVLMREKSVVSDNLHALAEAGFSISLDDFGTGYASLTHIREPFIKEVKIDRSFVMGSSGSLGDQQIVAAIVHMASKLNLKMVAEGIEDEEVLRKLRALGCTTGQGFVFAPALPFEQAAELLGRQGRIFALLDAVSTAPDAPPNSANAPSAVAG
ncbi:MAG: bifunctional diguanylate cyclase/phosphodiesterase, partial [Pseudomonadota bacterium]